MYLFPQQGRRDSWEDLRGLRPFSGPFESGANSRPKDWLTVWDKALKNPHHSYLYSKSVSHFNIWKRRVQARSFNVVFALSDINPGHEKEKWTEWQCDGRRLCLNVHVSSTAISTCQRLTISFPTLCTVNPFYLCFATSYFPPVSCAAEYNVICTSGPAPS